MIGGGVLSVASTTRALFAASRSVTSPTTSSVVLLLLRARLVRARLRSRAGLGVACRRGLEGRRRMARRPVQEGHCGVGAERGADGGEDHVHPVVRVGDD